MYKKEGREKRRKKKKSLQRVRETKRERGGVESRDERAERESVRVLACAFATRVC